MTITTSEPGPAPFAVSIEVSDDHPRTHLLDDLATVIAAAARVRRTNDGEAPELQVWLQDASAIDSDQVATLGLVAYRDLLQLRCALPVAPSGITTRALDLDRDIDTLIALNNRAFAWHPEQGTLDRAGIEARVAEPWFDAAGCRILELDDVMAGFCWTKIHPAQPERGEPARGEIYVIAVDPAFHGRGLGGPMTRAGLEWLAAAGLVTAMLYVEADNAAALATYERIGFVPHSVNRAFRGALETAT